MNANELAEQAGLKVWQAYCDKKQEVEGLKDEIDRLSALADKWNLNHQCMHSNGTAVFTL